ncbi:hypothetical protein [Niveispirillum sp. KHB5.9]|uniref:hypothetical protein n=1 Tax=Niveispirillum sp. KHB5.9 TaxID=3400269 RepID=UPI003A8B01F1
MKRKQTLIGDIGQTLVGMFLADLRLTLSTLALLCLVHVLRLTELPDPVVGGLLLAGCLSILVDAALQGAERRRPE